MNTFETLGLFFVIFTSLLGTAMLTFLVHQGWKAVRRTHAAGQRGLVEG